MTKRIYVSYVEKFQGDSFDICVSFDRAEAYKAGYEDRKYTAERDRLNRQWVIAECDVPVEDGQTAEEAYREFLANDGDLPGGDYITSSPAVKVTDKAKLFDSIKAEALICLESNYCRYYSVNDDMSISEDDNGILCIDCRVFDYNNYVEYLDGVNTDNPDVLKSEVIRQFYDIDDDATTEDEINKAIAELEECEEGSNVYLTFN